jgi:hypothetical protein
MLLVWGAIGVATTGGLAANVDKLHVSVGKEQIDFKLNDQLIGSYCHGEKLAKPYFSPLQVPGGTPLTDFAPSDHIHHKSVWFCHGDVIPEGIELKTKVKNVAGVDFWSEHAGHGKIVCVEVGKPESLGVLHQRVRTRNEWRTSDGVKILDEVRTLHVCALFGPDAHLLIFECELTASVCPIVFGDTKEGAMGLRVHPQLTGPKGGQLRTATGKTGEKDIWGHPAAWCDYFGKVDSKAVGVAIFDDPANPAPACWHSRAYGLHAANPFGRAKSGFPAQKSKTELVKLAKGATLKLRYGVYAHVGDTATAKVAEAFAEFVAIKKDG